MTNHTTKTARPVPRTRANYRDKSRVSARGLPRSTSKITRWCNSETFLLFAFVVTQHSREYYKRLRRYGLAPATLVCYGEGGLRNKQSSICHISKFLNIGSYREVLLAWYVTHVTMGHPSLKHFHYHPISESLLTSDAVYRLSRSFQMQCPAAKGTLARSSCIRLRKCAKDMANPWMHDSALQI